MRDYNLRFFMARRWSDGIENLLEVAIEKVPEKSGAYILGSNDGTNFIYPWGVSPIYYIGQSTCLKKRLRTHKKHILSATDDHEELYWWPRYQYGASFGAYVAWYSVKGQQDPQILESDLITSFYEMYGSIPVANGTWPSGLSPNHGTKDG